MIWDYGAGTDVIGAYLPAGSLRNILEIPSQQNIQNFGTENIITGYNGINTKYYYSDVVVDSSSNSGNGEFYFRKKKKGVTSAGNNVKSGDDLGNINFQGWHTDNYYTSARIFSELYNTPDSAIIPGVLRFYTANTAGTLAERFSINYADIRTNLNIEPATNDGAGLGSTNRKFSDLYLASGAVVNFNSGDVTLTHGTDVLTVGGGNLALGVNSLTMTGSIAATGSRVTKGWFTDLEVTNPPTINGVGYFYGLEDTIQQQLNTLNAYIGLLENTIDSLTLEVDTLTNNTVQLADEAVMLVDVKPLFVFGAGGGNAGDTTAFTTSTIYGAFYNSSADTLVVTNLRAVLAGTSPSVTLDVMWHATLSSGSAVHLNTSLPTITSTTTGDEDTSFANTKIPPGVWVWATTPTVTTKPTFMVATLSGAILRTE